jgi:hypothetical protein
MKNAPAPLMHKTSMKRTMKCPDDDADEDLDEGDYGTTPKEAHSNLDRGQLLR